MATLAALAAIRKRRVIYDRQRRELQVSRHVAFLPWTTRRAPLTTTMNVSANREGTRVRVLLDHDDGKEPEVLLDERDTEAELEELARTLTTLREDPAA